MINSGQHDVFISYSKYNRQYADAICNYLEREGIRCWYAPRNIMPGRDWAGEIVRGIESCKIFVLVLSPNSNESEQVKREVNLSVNNRLTLINFIVENTEISKSLEYYLSTVHWIDAISKPMEDHLKKLVNAVSAVLELSDTPKSKSTDYAQAVNRFANVAKKCYIVREKTGESFVIPIGTFFIGYERNKCHLIIDNNLISRIHACILLREDYSMSIEDLRSGNHTFINDHRITPLIEYEINVTDKIKLANETFTFRIEDKI